jgi:hypothetical protein
MLYKLKVRVLKSRVFNRIASKLNSLFGLDIGFGEVPDRLKEDLIRQYVPGRSFADIGCMWRVNGLFSFVAEDAGAVSVAAVDIYPASAEFAAELQRLGSRVEFIHGDILDPATIEAIGQRDVVFCSGLLYHTPNPIDTLMKLRLICKGTLILNTSTVPEQPGIKNFAVFYPYLEDAQRQVWALGAGAMGISTPYVAGQGYGNWFWGFSHSCLESMLRCAGFRVIERHGNGFLSCVVCEVVEAGFAPVSGDWTVALKTKR